MSTPAAPQWLPLEANPDVLNGFAAKIGLEDWQFHDVFGLEPELLSFVPRPVKAVLMVFPITESYGPNARAEQERIDREGQVLPEGHFFVDQTIANACGTIGVLHAIANNPDAPLRGGSFIAEYLAAHRTSTPAVRAEALQSSRAVEEIHVAASHEGDTRPPAPEDEVALHFICFVNVGGHLLEFDGCKSYPINHGATCSDTVLEDVVQVVRKFIATIDSINFNLIALSAASADVV